MLHITCKAGMRLAALTIAAGFSLASLPSPARADATQYPLTLQNGGSTVTFDKAPQRVVSIGQSSTEILLSLGLADKIVGTAVWVGRCCAIRGAERTDQAPRRQ